MSREILFKAKRIDNGEWVEGFYVNHFTGTGIKHYIYTGAIDELGPLYLTPCRYEVDPETLCQYTGLTGNNGEKIWENDIVKDGVVLGSVVWDKHYAQFMIDDVYDGHQEYTGWWNGVEVIGNIFDNPELLKQEG